MIFDLVLGFVIGLALGLLGGGGSILTVPALVYAAGQNPRAAVTASLIIVGINSLSGMLLHRRSGAVDLRVALQFGGAGMIAAYASSLLSRAFSPTSLLIAFGLLMLIVAALMLFSKPAVQASTRGTPVAAMLVGAGVGALTGFLGVGGGFLIVPALVMVLGLPMRQSVGTSLLIIAMNSLAGLLGHIGEAIDWQVVALFAAAGMAGVVVGVRLMRVVEPQRLRQVFAVFVVGMAIFVLTDNIGKALSQAA